MKTIITTIFVILITTTFAFASQAVSDGSNFPYFHLGCLIMGGLTIISLKHRYEKLMLSEAIGSFALYAVLVVLFTEPIISTVYNVVR